MSIQGHFNQRAQGRARAGFTLIEIIAVIMIIGILSVLLLSNLWGANEGARAESTRTLILQLQTAANSYEIETGDYPPSHFATDEAANEGVNVGIEAFVAALFSNGYEAFEALTDDQLENVDGDSATKPVSDLGRQLFEAVDAWGNPIAYIHNRDYEDTSRQYVTYDAETGELVTTFVLAHRNDKTNRYQMKTKFQFISAASDGVFGTEDDITNFGR